MKTLDELLAGETSGLTKKELLKRTRERDRLERALGGIKDMGGVPDIVFVIDTNKESIAINEALKLHIPVIAIVDTNSDPTNITYPIPGNDDAARAITLYCDLMARAVLDGISASQTTAGVDVGAAEDPGPVVLPDLAAVEVATEGEAKKEESETAASDAVVEADAGAASDAGTPADEAKAEPSPVEEKTDEPTVSTT